ncbi:MAG: hypothetical protein QM776_05760 [Rhodocyclaceae bacterium]
MLEADMALLDRYDITDWNKQKFDPDLIIKYGKWWVNEDKSIIFKALGGGSCEIPEMFSLVYQGVKVHIEYDRSHARNYDSAPDTRNVLISNVRIPAELTQDQDVVLTLIAEAFAAPYLSAGNTKKVVVEFMTFPSLAAITQPLAQQSGSFPPTSTKA